MRKKTWVVLAGSTVIFLAGMSAGSMLQSGIAHAQASKHVYELRTYTAPDGKLGELHARFRDHTIRIFNKHGMKSVIYLSPQDAPDSANTLIYVLEHPSREAAKKAWADFQADPEWVKVAADSQVNGRIVSKVVSVFADPTDYSPMK
jgi:NIPSNAP